MGDSTQVSYGAEGVKLLGENGASETGAGDWIFLPGGYKLLTLQWHLASAQDADVSIRIECSLKSIDTCKRHPWVEVTKSGSDRDANESCAYDFETCAVAIRAYVVSYQEAGAGSQVFLSVS